MGVPINSRYWGGGFGAGTGGHDSVTMSIQSLEGLVSAPGGMGAMLPDPDDEAGFRRQGFMKSEGE